MLSRWRLFTQVTDRSREEHEWYDKKRSGLISMFLKDDLGYVLGGMTLPWYFRRMRVVQSESIPSTAHPGPVTAFLSEDIRNVVIGEFVEEGGCSSSPWRREARTHNRWLRRNWKEIGWRCAPDTRSGLILEHVYEIASVPRFRREKKKLGVPPKTPSLPSNVKKKVAYSNPARRGSWP